MGIIASQPGSKSIAVQGYGTRRRRQQCIAASPMATSVDRLRSLLYSVNQMAERL